MPRVNPEWKYDALLESPNQLVAIIRNAGKKDDAGVRILFEVADWGAGQGAPGSWQTVSIETVDVPARGAVEARSAEWIPWDTGARFGQHYCLRATILGAGDMPGKEYEDPDGLAEVDVHNNQAQSNLARFISSTNSPSSRVGTAFVVHNPTDQDGYVYITVEQSNPLYRFYLETTWLYLKAGEKREVSALSEFAGEEWEGTPEYKVYRDLPSRVQLSAHMPGIDGSDSSIVLGGATMDVVEGRGTKIVDWKAEALDVGIRLSGRVVEKASGAPVDDGAVLLLLRDPDEGRARAHRVQLKNGDFVEDVTADDWAVARALFVPAPGWADSLSADLSNPTR